jgi:hypothetical protein
MYILEIYNKRGNISPAVKNFLRQHSDLFGELEFNFYARRVLLYEYRAIYHKDSSGFKSLERLKFQREEDKTFFLLKFS